MYRLLYLIKLIVLVLENTFNIISDVFGFIGFLFEKLGYEIYKKLDVLQSKKKGQPVIYLKQARRKNYYKFFDKKNWR